MIKEINKVVKNLTGNILTIGFTSDAEFITKLDNSKKVNNVFTLTNKDDLEKNKKGRLFAGKIVSIKKIKKLFKNKKISYILIELSSVDKFLSTIIKNSIDIANKNVYIFLDSNKIEHMELKKRYERYGCECIMKNNVLNVNCENVKTKKLQNFKFFLKDLNYDIQEILAYILIGA